MLFYFNGEGKIIKTIPKPIYQGSNKANTIYFIAPVTATAKVNVSFILPNGFITKQNTMVAQGQMSGIEAPDNSLFNVWSFDIPAIVTAYSGAVTTQFFIIADKSIITTQTVKFAVSKGVSAILPQAPSQNIYNDILIALQNITEQVYSNTSGTLGLEYEVNVDGTAILIGYNGTSKDIIIPEWYIKNGIYYPVAKIDKPFNNFFEIESVIIPESVNSIGEAFSNQKNLKTVVIPKNVVSLTGTFKDSLEIENIIFEGSLPTITDNVFLNTGANSKGLQVFVKPEFFSEFYNFLEVEKNFPLKVVTTITNIQINELQGQISGVSSAVQEQERINTQQTENIQANAENIQELERITAFNTGNILILQNKGYVTIQDVKNEGFVTKAVEDLKNYYLKTETYSKEEINELHEQLTGLGIAFKTVDTLPEVGEEKFIYLLPSTVEENDIYDEYVWIKGKFERIGSTKVNLADYYTKEKIDEKFVEVNQTIEQTAQNVEKTYATKTSLNEKADISSVYTKSETDEKISDEIDNIKDSYLDKETYQENQKNVATKDEVKNKLDISTATQTYATKSELTQKANTSDVYKTTEVDSKLDVVNKDLEELFLLLTNRYEEIPDASKDSPPIMFTRNGVTAVKIPKFILTQLEDGTYELVSMTRNTGKYVTMPEYFYDERVGANVPITAIGKYAFTGAFELLMARLPTQIKIIGDYAFENCIKLRELEIPNNVTSIGVRAFMWCGSLTEITIPDSVTSPISESFFFQCENLKKVTIGNNVPSIGNKAFFLCKSLDEIVIPDSVTSIGEGAFYTCSSLTSVTIGNGVTSIGTAAFNMCSSLKKVNIKAIKPFGIVPSAFWGIHEDCIFTVPKGSLSAYQLTSVWSTLTTDYTFVEAEE